GLVPHADVIDNAIEIISTIEATDIARAGGGWGHVRSNALRATHENTVLVQLHGAAIHRRIVTHGDVHPVTKRQRRVVFDGGVTAIVTRGKLVAVARVHPQHVTRCRVVAR